MKDGALKVGVIAPDEGRAVRVDHPLTQAYIGDAVWELYVRHHLVARGIVKPHELQRRSIQFVSATAQANVLQKLLPELTEEEQDIVRRGRNAKSKTAPKNAAILDYRHSTAVESLIGFLFLTDRLERLAQLMERVFHIIETEGNKADE